MTAPPKSPFDRFPEWVLGLVVFVLPVLVFAPLLQAGFVLDDESLVTLNPAVRNFDLGAIFGNGYWANVTEGPRQIAAAGDLYRPLTVLSLAISHQVFGTEPGGYHAENIVFHALASFLVVGLLRDWKLSRAAAFFGGLLFAVAPIHIEPVASVVLRNEILSAIFSVLALRAVVRGRVALASLGFGFALLTKESAVAVPFIALLVDYVVLRVSNWRERRPVYLGMLVVFVVYLVIRASVLGQLGLGDAKATYFGDAGALIVWLTMAKFAVEHYLSAALIGTPLVFDYSRESVPDALMSDAGAWMCLVGWFAIAAVLLFFALRKRAAWTCGPLLFLLAIGPTSNVLLGIGVLGATRLMYFPYLGVAMTIVVFGAWLASRFAGARKAILVIGVLVVAAYVVQSIRRSQPFLDEYRLYVDIVRHAPRNSHAQINAGHRALDFAMGKRQPPAEFAQRTAEEWREEALRRYMIAGQEVPLNLASIRRALVFVAVEQEEVALLATLLDRAMQAQHPQVRLAPLPKRGFDEQVPLRPADRALLQEWAAGFQPLAKLGPDDLLVAKLTAILPDYFEIRALRRAKAILPNRVALARRLRQRIARRLQGLPPMLNALFAVRVGQRVDGWVRDIESGR